MFVRLFQLCLKLSGVSLSQAFKVLVSKTCYSVLKVRAEKKQMRSSCELLRQRNLNQALKREAFEKKNKKSVTHLLWPTCCDEKPSEFFGPTWPLQEVKNFYFNHAIICQSLQSIFENFLAKISLSQPKTANSPPFRAWPPPIHLKNKKNIFTSFWKWQIFIKAFLLVKRIGIRIHGKLPLKE